MVGADQGGKARLMSFIVFDIASGDGGTILLARLPLGRDAG